MKTKLLLLLVAVFKISIQLQAQVLGKAFDYPINPEMEIWSELKSFEEMQAAVNIPVTILDKMHTADLVATCLEYPLFPVISAYNYRQSGFTVIRSDR